jgi:two-component system sensor histidine kinase YesM
MVTNRSSYFNQMHVKLALAISSTTVIAVTLLSIIVYLTVSSIFFNDAYKQTSEAVNQSGNYIEGYLDKVKSVSDLLAMHPQVVEVLKQSSLEDQGAVSSLLELTKDSDARILSIAIIGLDGRVLSAGEDMLKAKESDMMAEPWYIEAKNSHQMPALTSVRRTEFTMDKELWVISIAREIVDAEGEHLGVLLIDIDYNLFVDYLTNLDLGSRGYVFIVSVDGQVVYHPDASYFGDAKMAASLVEICELGEGYKSEMGLMTFKTTIGHSDWIMVGLSSLDNLSFLRRQLVETVFFVSVALVLFGVFSAIYVAKKVTSPIKSLESAMREIDESWKHVNLPADATSEVLSLTKQYNLMLDHIKLLLDEVKTNQVKLRAFEIQSLQSQINPHFLYNTLDTIVWLAEFGETNKVVSVTQALAQLLRVTLKGDDGLIDFDEELNHVRAYLAIQEQRYEDALSYEITVDIQTQGFKVPKLILQPIVENAIYHGIREGSGVGRILIRAFEMESVLSVEIVDNGRGFEVGSREKDDRVKLGGVGISNVDQRLRLIFGSEYGLVVESELGKGTCVRYRIPKM